MDRFSEGVLAIVRALLIFCISISAFAAPSYAIIPRTFTCPSVCNNNIGVNFGCASGCVEVTNSLCGGSSYVDCAPPTPATVLNNSLCSAFNTTSTVIYILALLLILLGGTLYAGSHIMPSQQRGTIQGYGMGMIMGGIIGVVISLLAPWILNVVTGNAALITSACG